MAFHDVRFPTSISFNSTGGPERRTEVVALVSGHEERNTPWAHSRRRYNAGLGVRSLNDVHTLIAFFEARQGRLHGFRWKDWADFRSGAPLSTTSPADQVIGTGTGSLKTFALRKTYSSGPHAYTRPIAKPVAGTVLCAVNGSVIEPGTGFTVDVTTGLVTFATAPAVDAIVTAGFEFDVPARFDTDFLEINLAAFQAGEVPRVPIVELRLP